MHDEVFFRLSTVAPMQLLPAGWRVAMWSYVDGSVEIVPVIAMCLYVEYTRDAGEVEPSGDAEWTAMVMGECGLESIVHDRLLCDRIIGCVLSPVDVLDLNDKVREEAKTSWLRWQSDVNEKREARRAREDAGA